VYRVMRARRLEDRIRGLIGHALIAEEHDLKDIVSELRSCLREHAKRLREKTLKRLARGEFKERRHSATLRVHASPVESQLGDSSPSP
jgi:hypothetical protein